MDTWDLKPESEKNGGEFKPIDTAAPGVKISEHLPNVAKQFKHLSVIRSLDSKEGNHDRGTYMMHTGYQPNPTVVHPNFGSVCSYELGEKMPDFDLPHCISINTPSQGAGLPRDVALAVHGRRTPTPRSPTSSPPRGSTTSPPGPPDSDAQRDREELPEPEARARRPTTTRRFTPRRSG